MYKTVDSEFSTFSPTPVGQSELTRLPMTTEVEPLNSTFSDANKRDTIEETDNCCNQWSIGAMQCP